jgi:hypothetical protein
MAAAAPADAAGVEQLDAALALLPLALALVGCRWSDDGETERRGEGAAGRESNVTPRPGSEA